MVKDLRRKHEWPMEKSRNEKLMMERPMASGTRSAKNNVGFLLDFGEEACQTVAGFLHVVEGRKQQASNIKLCHVLSLPKTADTDDRQLHNWRRK